MISQGSYTSCRCHDGAKAKKTTIHELGRLNSGITGAQAGVGWGIESKTSLLHRGLKKKLKKVAEYSLISACPHSVWQISPCKLLWRGEAIESDTSSIKSVQNPFKNGTNTP